jgi:hypothetical protein
MKKLVLITAAILLSPLLKSLNVQAQNAAQPNLQDLLKPIYKVTTAGNDNSGFKVIEPGTIVSIQKTGVIATPNTGSPQSVVINPFEKACSNNFKNGELTKSKTCNLSTLGSRYLDKGWKLYITKFEVNPKQNKITFTLVDCGPCNNTPKNGALRAMVSFQFGDKFLEGAEPGQVTDVINQVLAPDEEATRAVGGQTSAPSARRTAPTPGPAQAADAPSVNIGDTPQQVIAKIGKPKVILQEGQGKVIYKYKDFKVVFVGGKVAQVE